jgi:hypothetical protein
VFHVSAQLADGTPVQRGFEILLPLYPILGADPALPYCVNVTVPDAYENSADLNYLEYPVGTVTVRGTKDMAYPAVIPGTYTLDAGCRPDGNTASPLVLGSVTVPTLGVAGGIIDNAMVVFSEHASGGVTTVTYGAIGNNDGSSLNPPADDACIDGGGKGSEVTFWQPVSDLVSQQVNGRQEWFGTGTLVFRDSQGQSPRGRFFYDCAEDVPNGLSGITVP